MKLLEILNEIQVPNLMSYSIIVGDKTEGEDTYQIVVAPEDLGKMNWYKAIKACKKLGGGKWRLPNLKELRAMYNQLHIEGKGNFVNDTYWSINGNYTDMSNGKWSYCRNYTREEHRVRPVLTLEKTVYT